MHHTDTRSPTIRLFLGDMLDPELNSFGAVRLAMALAVLASHCWYLASGSDAYDPFLAATGYTLGEIGVQVFFIVSGTMVARSFDRSRGIADFAAARILRIVPALAACVAVTALLVGPLVSSLTPAAYYADPGVALYILKTLTLSTGSAPLPGVFELNPAPRLVNISVWTLKYEVLCYAGLVAVSLAVGRIESRLMQGVLVALAVGVILWKRPILGPDNSFADNIRYFAVFFATGVTAYRFRDKLPVSWQALAPLAGLFVLALGSRFQEPAMALFFGYAAIWTASFRLNFLRPITGSRDLSYGVYIFSVPVTQVMLQSYPGISPGTLIFATASVSLALAWLSWHALEKPALRARPIIAAFANRLLRAKDSYKASVQSNAAALFVGREGITASE